MAKFDLTEGAFAPGNARFAIVASRFNGAVVERLLQGAVDAFARHGVQDSALTVINVPGAFEIPMITRRLAASGRYAAIVTLGAVIRGGTPHFEYVAGECARGVARVALDLDIPVIFGVLTVDDMEQALARAGGDEGNKGSEAALAALEMVTVLQQLDK